MEPSVSQHILIHNKVKTNTGQIYLYSTIWEEIIVKFFHMDGAKAILYYFVINKTPNLNNLKQKLVYLKQYSPPKTSKDLCKKNIHNIWSVTDYILRLSILTRKKQTEGYPGFVGIPESAQKFNVVLPNIKLEATHPPDRPLPPVIAAFDADNLLQRTPMADLSDARILIRQLIYWRDWGSFH